MFGSKYAYRLKLSDIEGNTVYTDNKIVQIEEAQFTISDINPNPVNSILNFSVNVSVEQNVKISIFDISGKEILVIHDDYLPKGNNPFHFDNINLNSGTYNIFVGNDQQKVIKQFTVVK